MPDWVGNGRFQLIGQLGEGGQGSVWLARDDHQSSEGAEERVALKFIGGRAAADPRAVDRLRKEVMVVRKLSHPCLVKVYDWHDCPGERLFYSMEYVRGEDLGKHLQTSSTGRFTVSQIMPWIQQLVAGLSYCHGVMQVFHRDLKPGNVILTEDGRIRLVDFGLAQGEVLDGMGGATRGMTRAYASPQQAAGEFSGATDDIYSLGAVVYHLLTGRPPAPAGEETENPRSLVLAAGGSYRDVTPEASDTVMRCLDPNPDRRPRNVEEFWQWFSHSGPVDRVAEIVDSGGDDARGGGGIAVMVGWLLMASVVVGLVWRFGTGEVQKPDEKPLPPQPPPTNGPSAGTPIPPTQFKLDIRLHPEPSRQVTAVLIPDGGGPPIRIGPEIVASNAYQHAISGEAQPGRYWIEVGQTRRPENGGWVRRELELGDSTVKLEISLERVPVQLLMPQSNGVILVDAWTNRTRLRAGDRVITEGRYKMVTGYFGNRESADLKLVRGSYSLELVPEMELDWILDETALTVTDSQTHRVTPRRRLHPRMPVSWTVNHLLTGTLRFLPVPGRTNVLACATETTRRQFEAFARDVGLEPVPFPSTLDTKILVSWRTAFPDSTDLHPVVGVSWFDATNYAGWLTRQFRQQRLLTDRQYFRLPTCDEWTRIAGPDPYPWGPNWPPPSGKVNIAGKEMLTNSFSPDSLMPTAYGAVLTASVDGIGAVDGGFVALAGNAAEWCLDEYEESMNAGVVWGVYPSRFRPQPGNPVRKVTRGGSWFDGNDREFLRTSTHWPESGELLSDRIGFRLVVVEEP